MKLTEMAKKMMSDGIVLGLVNRFGFPHEEFEKLEEEKKMELTLYKEKSKKVGMLEVQNQQLMEELLTTKDKMIEILQEENRFLKLGTTPYPVGQMEQLDTTEEEVIHWSNYDRFIFKDGFIKLIDHREVPTILELSEKKLEIYLNKEKSRFAFNVLADQIIRTPKFEVKQVQTFDTRQVIQIVELFEKTNEKIIDI